MLNWQTTHVCCEGLYWMKERYLEGCMDLIPLPLLLWLHLVQCSPTFAPKSV